MKKRPLRLGCVLVGLLALILLGLGGGAWWYFRGQFTTTAASSSPVQVTLLSPVSGDEVAAGDLVPLNLRALAPEAISWSEVFVDGLSLGAVAESPEHASWTWQAWPAGVHVLTGRAQAADGQMGESQTVILNVLALRDVIQAPAGAGQTLGDVGAKFGVPPDKMAGANPKIDPSKPLPDGQPVNVPTGGAGGSGQPQPPAGGGSGSVGPYLSITWKFKASEPVDKSYCYTSIGDGNWEKMPKQPFEFFPGLENVYTQVLDALPPGKPVFQMQCWGWLGDALKFLGQAQAEKAWDGGVVSLIGQSFVLTGTPGGNGPQADVVGPQIPAPYAFRQTTDVTDCFAHKGNLDLCKLIAGKMLNDILVVWEWQPGANWPGQTAWLNKINGYRVYQLASPGSKKMLLQEVTSPAVKVTAVQLPLGKACYGVEAYAESYELGGLSSAMTTFCIGESPATQKITLAPTQWMTAVFRESTGDCEDVGLASKYVYEQNINGFGFKPEVVVGSFLRDEDCYVATKSSGALKFDSLVLPPGAVVQKAILKFSKLFLDYGASGMSLGAKPQSCVSSLGRATADLPGYVSPDHFMKLDIQYWGWFKPITSVFPYLNEVDVTWTVADWLAHASSNHGFILVPVPAPKPADGGVGRCESGLGNFQLVIHYFTP
ncbi:MAG: Ig-like domain-containing protein [Chloroflexota bacterium]